MPTTKRKSKAAKSEALESLHNVLAEKLTKAVKSPQCDAATLSVARAFLKDNRIEVADASTLKDLAEAVTDNVLPFPTEEEESVTEKRPRKKA